jgi:D-amino-acid dehydrogenase
VALTVDTLVVGGGLAGATTFFELARRGRAPLLIEAADDLALGASYANGAMLTPSMSDPWNGPGVGWQLAASLFDPHSAMKLHLAQVPRLARWGIEFLANSTPKRHWLATLANFRLAQYSLEGALDAARMLDLDLGGSPAGSLKIFESNRAMAGPLALGQRLADEGLAFEVLDARGAVAVEPSLEPIAGRIAGAIRYPGDAVGDARRFTLALGAAGRQAGGKLRLGERIERLAKESDGFTAETDKGVITARQVVLAAGIASPRLARHFGIRLPIQPAKGYSLTYRLPSEAEGPRTAVVDDAMHAAVVPLGDRLRAVGTAEFAGEDRRVDPRRLDSLARLLARLYPNLAPQLDRETAKGWAGLRPMSADGRPFVGQTSCPGLWINAGHGHLGWTMAVGSARLLADLMTGQPPAIDPHPFAIGAART